MKAYSEMTTASPILESVHLFDFTTGVSSGSLGAQFKPGYLNQDRRNVGNIFGSYAFPSGFTKGLTLGLGLRGQSGIPINKLASHPVYTDPGEVPIGGRGAAGTEASSLQLDLHSDYVHALSDKLRLRLGFDTFNVTNSKYTLNKSQDIDTGFLSGPNAAFLTRQKSNDRSTAVDRYDWSSKFLVKFGRRGTQNSPPFFFSLLL